MRQTSNTLPLSKAPLIDWQLVKVSGSDSEKFLQGQLTNDITKLTADHYLRAAHCDPKGKVLADLLLFKHQDDIYYLVRKSVVETQLKELKKYAVFSKVQITLDEELSVIGMMGSQEQIAESQLNEFFDDSKNCVTNQSIIYLKIEFPLVRYIAIGKKQDFSHFDNIKETTCKQWQALDMQANYPVIDLPAVAQFLPQAMNLQNFDAISFDKGCYCGQEMVARAQFRGINKRTLFLLVGKAESLPTVGQSIEQKMGENWRETGFILSALKLDDEQYWLQVVLNQDTEAETIFRLKDQGSSEFKIKL